MATLYELTDALKNFELDIDEETGEILNSDELDALELERDTKIENIALWVKNLLSDAEAYKREKDNFYSKEKAAKNKAERLKGYLEYVLAGDKFKSDRVTISYRKSESLNILTVMGYYEPDVLIANRDNFKEAMDAFNASLEGTNTQVTDWAPTNPATDVMDEEF